MDDLFESGPKQFGLDLGETVAPVSYAPDPAEVRAELIEILDAARSATDEAPWDERTHLYHKVVFPQMAQWLPDDERDQLCFDFAREVERIELLMAA
ncbi:hypothetical protein PIB19_03925 [Sphingomonas sp. 7/4-4]|uniref:hypothetical protein n=1 Tax=Sphingomonas sp. 7/4-4 TaxID=3018446 RepID=UPI0022F39928|nr:hypothetical protein [Sphingomonas sp. 7/4-4]WBY08626.1 hypothetical protein PIB19_03925 [Sphingomonas sp. 7/4-4]